MTGKQKSIGVILGMTAILLILIFFLTLKLKEVREVSEFFEIEEEIIIPEITEDFDTAVTKLNNSRALIKFLNKYFEIEYREGFIAYTPQEFYQRQKGNIYDFSVFAAYVLWQNGFEAGVIRFNYQVDGEEKNHAVTVFRDTDLPKYITVTEAGVQIFNHGWSFKELIQAEEKRLNIRVTEYDLFYPDIIDLSPKKINIK